MKTLTCAATRRRLHAFHDRELSVSDEIAVAAHLEWCDSCAAALTDLQLVRGILRAGASRRPMLAREDEAWFNVAVLNRARAEQDASWYVWLRLLFEDLHLVYAGVGAAVAAAVCVVIMLGMMRFAGSNRPDSLAAMVAILATPGSNENPVPVDSRVLLPRALDETLPGARGGAGSEAQADAVFAFAAVVTREGRIANLELLRSGHPTNESAASVDLLDAVSRTRFEPGRMAGLPVAVNMVWLLAQTTVRPARNAPIDLPIAPPGKKRASVRQPAAVLA